MRLLRRPMDRRVKPGDDALLRSRGAPSHPSFAHATKSQAKKRHRQSPPLKKKGGGAPIGAHSKSRIEKRHGAHPVSRPPFSERTEAARTSRSGRARLSAPHRGTSPGFIPARLGPRFLEPPDASGRTLSGTSAASTSQSDTCRTGRCPSRPCAQCIRRTHENRSRSASRSTLAKASFVERDIGDVFVIRIKVKSDAALLGTRNRAA
jgi:hypothetical protein